MKTKLTKLTFLFGLLAILGCETEPLMVEEGLSLQTSSSTVKPEKTIEWDECSTLATEVNLLAGQNMLVGTVKVEVVGDNYEITYEITNSGYCLTETHLSVADSPNDFPMGGGGNPKNGHFEYGDVDLDCLSSITYIVPTSKGTYIAAHAVVNCKTKTEAQLPSTVSACVTGLGGDSYFDIEINSEDILKGPYGSVWCVDYDTRLADGHCFDADVYSSTGSFPDDNFEHPGNFGAINWIINQHFVGKETSTGDTYDFADVQWAIWKLIEGEDFTGFTASYFNPDFGLEIYEMAIEHLDFSPDCDDVIAIILIPQDGSQSIIIDIPYECDEGECEETAWGDGCDFPGNNWATYFEYGIGG